MVFVLIGVVFAFVEMVFVITGGTAVAVTTAVVVVVFVVFVGVVVVVVIEAGKILLKS